MKTIPLTKCQVAMVDDEDFERLSAHKWYAHLDPHTKSYYAVRNSKKNRGRKEADDSHAP